MTAASVVARDLVVRFGGRAALDGCSLTAHGGVVALLGPNGAGKTTLLRCLATVRSPDSGTVHVDGLATTDASARVQVRRRLGYLPQDVDFSPKATVFDVVDYLGIVKEVGPASRRHAHVVRSLQAVGLEEHAHRKVGELSGGMKQRLGVAQAILGTPSLVILDEPANGLDPEQRLRLRDRLSRLGERATVIVSTHLTEEAAAFSQVLHVMDRGRIVYSGTPAGLTATARGRVWVSRSEAPRGAGVRASWHQPDGSFRTVGDHPPAGAVAADPTLEDAYLLLVTPE